MREERLRIPRHIAIIMDGNGRWAAARGLPRVAGHRAGVEALKRVVRSCGTLGVRYLTVYAFSTENWRRPRPEVDALMRLLVEALRREVAELSAQGVRVNSIGEAEGLPPLARRELERAQALTAGNTGLVLNLAINYGGRRELARAARLLAVRVRAGELDPEEVDEAAVAGVLYTAGQPDPELLIRSSGENRLSNFLLWQAAYSELWISPVLWPDFREEHLLQAVREFNERERRFGGLKDHPADGRA